MSRFVEMNYEEELKVTGGEATIFVIIGAVSAVCGLLGVSLSGAYDKAEEKAYNKAYDEAYDAEMLRLNMENPIPWGDIIRESY